MIRKLLFFVLTGVPFGASGMQMPAANQITDNFVENACLERLCTIRRASVASCSLEKQSTYQSQKNYLDEVIFYKAVANCLTRNYDTDFTFNSSENARRWSTTLVETSKFSTAQRHHQKGMHLLAAGLYLHGRMPESLQAAYDVRDYYYRALLELIKVITLPGVWASAQKAFSGLLWCNQCIEMQEKDAFIPNENIEYIFQTMRLYRACLPLAITSPTSGKKLSQANTLPIKPSGDDLFAEESHTSEGSRIALMQTPTKTKVEWISKKFSSLKKKFIQLTIKKI